MRTQKSLSKRTLPDGKLVELWDRMRNEVLDYLEKNADGRQGAIGRQVGLRRERICAYVVHRKGLTDVYTIQELHNWMLKDRKSNGHG